MNLTVSPVLDSLRFWSVLIAIYAAIVLLGWKQPLRYRFMSAEEIYELEHPTPPQPPAGPAKSDWHLDPNRRTPLDRAPYNETGYRGGGARGLSPITR